MATAAYHPPYDPLSTNAPYAPKPSLPNDNPAPKFPHTRAQLAALARQFKPLDPYDDDDNDRVPPRLLNQVISLLIDEREDDLKSLLKAAFGVDDHSVEHCVLDLMHKHRDDVAGVPFLFLTPTRRPISRPSSRASTTSNRLRPETPISAPTSPLINIFRRPPNSPLAPMSSKSDYSPSSSPVLTYAQAPPTQFTASLPASPISSPRLLNAKANEFRPIPRPLSAAASHSSAASLLRADTPSPDLWAHNSPRATSNLAIAAPLIADQSHSFTPSSSLRSSHRPKDDDEEDDPFDPFSTNPIPTFHSITISDFDTFDSNSWQNSADLSYPSVFYPQEYVPEPESEEASAALTDGMTPFDVLSSVFGSTLAPSELEDALAANGFDFDRAMAWLVDRALPAAPAPQARMQRMGAGVTLVSRDAATASARGRGGAAPFNQAARPAPRYVNGRPVPGGNRVCRYFVGGECLRADCRFSHDLERALCRFWLRGTCAKQESCEFLHHLPKDVDIASLNAVLSKANVPPGTGPFAAQYQQQQQPAGPPVDEFPVLGYDANGAGRGGAPGRKFVPYNADPSRTRFAAAVKKPAQQAIGGQEETNGNGNGNGINASINSHHHLSAAARREAMGTAADNLHHQSAIVAPRASPRLKLHPPFLLPTLPTGDAVNTMYMAYRQRALQLGAARNACLSRAADAWRRGDGAAAKRFSREGHEMNGKMAVEMREAVDGLVRERARVAERAVRSRDAAWSDDPGDRGARGKACGGGLGVVLGVASAAALVGVGAGAGESAEERTEAMLDLHGLHANEATEVLEKFLLALESEHFYGLAYAIVGEEKHTGTQDIARGASRARLATGVREWLHRWGYPWSERDGIICVDPLTHLSE
ncbi:hypothetical protein JR316_0008226 [Psilocybe cubensis]|uniref:Uncharacterized protein n=2 Tax=Psilocybe cubensis TaxID=181762 RepID=A0ACB8GVI5_PSICU|nr:hypothetical protein JR316_0008226 [Psilocybe cubensis]KAH9479631.1 hypothetical protein JR316_0008226 [Psilocybe cubensis]